MAVRLPCKDCRQHTINGEYYMVHDEIWALATALKPAKFLCIACLESRIKRPLVAKDFKPCPLNHMNLHMGLASDRLLDRMQKASPTKQKHR